MIETFLLFVKGKALLLKMIGTASVIVVAVGSCMLRDHRIETKGATKEAAKITRQANEQGNQAAKRSAKVIRDAHAPGAFERLRRDPKTCTDCDR